MLKYAILIFGVVSATAGAEIRRQKVDDPFSVLDKHITHTLAYHYLWPWSQLIKAAAVLDSEESLEEPQIISDAEKFTVNMNVKRFKPDELRIKVKNRYIIIEGKRVKKENSFMANHFVQRFVLPPGSKQEEVVAVLNEKGVLSVTVPRHEVPPPPPEREVPIEVRLPEEKTQKPDKTEDKTEATTVKEIQTSSATPLETLDSEVTTHVGKIRKKELKTTTKATKDNEVTKAVDGNGLDYALIEAEE